MNQALLTMLTTGFVLLLVISFDALIARFTGVLLSMACLFSCDASSGIMPMNPYFELA